MEKLSKEFKCETTQMGTLIKCARKKMHLSRNELAQQCELSVVHLRVIENNKIVKPHLSSLQKLAKKLNLDLENLKQCYGYYSPVVSAGTFLKNARINANLSQKELSNRCNISPNELCKLERDKITRPHLTTLSKLAEQLKVDVKTLSDYFNSSNDH